MSEPIQSIAQNNYILATQQEVSHDNSLIGNGMADSPLGVVNPLSYPVKFVGTSAEATDINTLYVLTGSNYGVIVPTLFFNAVDPLNPLNLPVNTIRVKFKSGYTPKMGDTQTLVDSTNNVWDIYKEDNDWSRLFRTKTQLLEVLGANTTNVTDMSSIFNDCPELTTITLFDTSNVSSTHRMFKGCNNITASIPLFNTSKVIDMEEMFHSCFKVPSGALALYNQASTQTTPPTYHSNTFWGCGRDTQTGAAELAQIPSDWGGTLEE